MYFTRNKFIDYQSQWFNFRVAVIELTIVYSEMNSLPFCHFVTISSIFQRFFGYKLFDFSKTSNDIR